MWLVKLALSVALLGLVVLTFSWLLFADEWVGSSETWVLFEGPIGSVRGALLVMNYTEEVGIWVADNVSLEPGTFASVIARKSGEMYSAIRIVS